MNKKAVYIAGCVIGSGLIGFFANKLDTPIGIVLFGSGVLLITVSAYRAAKEDRK